MNPRLKTFLLLGAAAWLAAPAPALACAACYGASDSPLAKGMNWGILALLGVIVGVLAAISTFFVFIARRSAAQESAESASVSGLQPVNVQ